MSKHQRQSGFSIIEIVIASVILAIIVGSSMTFMSNTETKDTFRGKVQTENACLSEAHKILANIKEKGQRRTQIMLTPAMIIAGDYSFSAGETDQLGNIVDEFGIPHASRWPNPIMAPAPNNNVLRPHLTIMGYMNALQAMYNSNASGFCDNTNQRGLMSYGTGNIIVQPTTELLDSATDARGYLRIQLFNTGDGLISCPASVNIRPPGVDEPNLTARRRRPRTSPVWDLPWKFLPHPVGLATQEIFDVDPGSVFNLGFLVTATVQYQDRKGSTRSCRVQEKFQYNAMPENSLTYEFEDIEATINDGDIPENINTTVVSTNVEDPPKYTAKGKVNYVAGVDEIPIYNSCANTSGNTRNVSFRLTKVRPGSIFMCRDLSEQRAAIAYPTGGWNYSTNSANHTHGYNGFAVRFTEPMRTTFYSSELMQHAYWNGKESVDPDTNLAIAGLYYPTGTYYCLGVAGCGGGNSSTTNAELMHRALPRFPTGAFVNHTQGAPQPGTYRYYIPSDHGATTDTPQEWMPCERMAVGSYRVCSTGVVTPTGAYGIGFTEGNDTAGQQDAFQMQITGLPGGCEVHIQIAEVDAGYNIKATEFKEYIQEKTPGNKLCRNQVLGNSRFNDFDAMGAGTWFFSCTNGYTDAASAPACTGTSTGDCCVDYPFFPHYKAFVDP